MAAVKSSDVKDYLKIGLYLGGAFLAYKAIKGLAETFGLIQTEAENTLDHTSDQASGDSSTLNSSPFIAFNGNYAPAIVIAYNKKFKPKLWNAPKQMKLTQEETKQIIADLFEAKKVWFLPDNKDLVYGAFRKIQTQYQLSVISGLFYQVWRKDLLEWLKSFLNAEELLVVENMIKNYPQYFKTV